MNRLNQLNEFLVGRRTYVSLALLGIIELLQLWEVISLEPDVLNSLRVGS